MIDYVLVEVRMCIVDMDWLRAFGFHLTMLALYHLYYLLLFGHHLLLDQHVITPFCLGPRVPALDILPPPLLMNGHFVFNALFVLL